MNDNSLYSPGYTYPVSAPLPYTAPPELWAFVSNANSMLMYLSRENERQFQQLRHKAFAEEACAEAFSMTGKTFVLSASGRGMELMDDCVVRAVALFRDGPSLLPTQICLQFSAHSNPIFMDESEFLDDKRLLYKLQSAGIGVTVRKSVRQTATLIRQIVTKGMVSAQLSFYAGWTHEEKSAPRFLQLEPFSTHQHDVASWKMASHGSKVPMAAKVFTVQRFVSLFEPVCEDFLRWFLWVWFHAAFLFSLLPAAGKTLPLGACFYTQDPVIQLWVQKLLSWYGDVPVSLNDIPNGFLKSLWSRKDQPLVIIEELFSANAAKNAAILETVLATGKVPVQNRVEADAVPQQALVTIVSGLLSPLTNNQRLLVLDIFPEMVDRSLCCAQQIEPALLHEYLQVFAEYVEDHWLDFQMALDAGCSTAQTLCKVGTPSILASLGTLIGMSKFTSAFLGAQCPNVPQAWLDDLVIYQKLTEQLERLAFDTVAMDIADRFCHLMRKCLREGVYVVCPDGKDASGDERLPVYLYKGDYAFSRRAFQDMCLRLGASTAQVSRALVDARLLRGKSTNATTVQTRIQLFDIHGVARCEGVYRIDGASVELEF